MTNIFDKVKHRLEKAGHAIEETAKDTGKVIEKTATGAGSEIKKTTKGAISETEKLAQKAQDEGMDIGNQITDLANKTKKDLNALSTKAINDIKSAENTATGNVRTVGKEVSGGLEKTVTKELPKILATALSQLASEAMKPGLKGAAKLARQMGDEMDSLAKEDPELVKAINQCGFKLKIKANVELILTYTSFYTRVREMAAILDRAGNEGIAFRRRDLIGFVESMGPTTVAFGGGAEISLGFDLGGSASLTAIPLKLFTRLADRGLKELGVPA